jgi:hypothetical protein
MRHAVVLVALLAVAASPRGGCGKDPYEPCAGKSCGTACTVCDPADKGCVETAVVKACDAAGACEAAGTFTCTAPNGCAGKACGTVCTIDPPCRSAFPPCMMPSVMGFCDGNGTCGTAAPPCPMPCTGPAPGCYPDDPCAGKACGETCSPCPPGTACPMIMCAMSCDAAGRCGCTGTGTTCP